MSGCFCISVEMHSVVIADASVCVQSSRDKSRKAVELRAVRARDTTDRVTSWGNDGVAIHG